MFSKSWPSATNLLSSQQGSKSMRTPSLTTSTSTGRSSRSASIVKTASSSITSSSKTWTSFWIASARICVSSTTQFFASPLIWTMVCLSILTSATKKMIRSFSSFIVSWKKQQPCLICGYPSVSLSNWLTCSRRSLAPMVAILKNQRPNERGIL